MKLAKVCAFFLIYRRWNRAEWAKCKWESDVGSKWENIITVNIFKSQFVFAYRWSMHMRHALEPRTVDAWWCRIVLSYNDSRQTIIIIFTATATTTKRHKRFLLFFFCSICCYGPVDCVISTRRVWCHFAAHLNSSEHGQIDTQRIIECQHALTLTDVETEYEKLVWNSNRSPHHTHRGRTLPRKRETEEKLDNTFNS